MHIEKAIQKLACIDACQAEDGIASAHHASHYAGVLKSDLIALQVET